MSPDSPRRRNVRSIVITPEAGGDDVALQDARDAGQAGELLISFDYIGTGDGQLVLYEGGPESAMAFYPDMTGSDANILAIIDDIDM